MCPERDQIVKRNDGKIPCTHSDLVVVALVFHVLIKLFLRIKLNPTHFQFLSYLSTQQQHHLAEALSSEEELVAVYYFNNDFRNTAFISGTAGCMRCLVRLLKLTRCLNSCLSSMVIVSAFAMMGTMLTEWLRRFINSTSNWRRLGEEEEKSIVLTFLKMLRECQKDFIH